MNMKEAKRIVDKLPVVKVSLSVRFAVMCIIMKLCIREKQFLDRKDLLNKKLSFFKLG